MRRVKVLKQNDGSALLQAFSNKRDSGSDKLKLSKHTLQLYYSCAQAFFYSASFVFAVVGVIFTICLLIIQVQNLRNPNSPHVSLRLLSTDYQENQFALDQLPENNTLLSDPDSQSDCKRILWMIGFSWAPETIERINQIKYAVTTQKLRAPSLLPMVMYEGPPSVHPFLSWLQANGVIICSFKSSIITELEKAYMNKHMHGIYFRMVLNEYIDKCIGENNIFSKMVDLQYVLYTDSDVGFMSDINSCNIIKPEVISFGSEYNRPEIWNTGVLVYNLTEYLKYQKDFVEYCKQKQWRAPNWDQEFYQEFFRDKGLVDQLPDTWNWKPYWGYEQGTDFKIIHFHGPKPGMKCLDCLLRKKIKTFSKEKVACSDCVWSYEEIFTAGKNDSWKLYTDVVKEWKEIVFDSPPYYDNDKKEIIV